MQNVTFNIRDSIPPSLDALRVEIKTIAVTHVPLPGEEQTQTRWKSGRSIANVRKKRRQLERDFTITPLLINKQIRVRMEVDVIKEKVEATARESRKAMDRRVTDKFEQHSMKKPSGYPQ